jgi:hypothetical protein
MSAHIHELPGWPKFRWDGWVRACKGPPRGSRADPDRSAGNSPNAGRRQGAASAERSPQSACTKMGVLGAVIRLLEEGANRHAWREAQRHRVRGLVPRNSSGSRPRVRFASQVGMVPVRYLHTVEMGFHNHMLAFPPTRGDRAYVSGVLRVRAARGGSDAGGDAEARVKERS